MEIRKKKMLKFQEKANALSISKKKYGHKFGFNKTEKSLTGKLEIAGTLPSPIVLLLSGIPPLYCPTSAGVLSIHSSCLMGLGVPASIEVVSSVLKIFPHLPTDEVWIFKELRRMYNVINTSKKSFVFLSKIINEKSLPVLFFNFCGKTAGVGLFSEDVSGTGLVIFFFILCFLDILPSNF